MKITEELNLKDFKSNSTSSIFLSSTINTPNVKIMIKAVATILQSQLIEDMQLGKTVSSSSDLFYFSEEKYIEESPNSFDEQKIELIKKTPSNFDRSVEPSQGTSPKLNLPSTWTTSLKNGMKVYGIEQNEIPTVNFSLVIDGGHLLDDKSKNGIANLMTDIMMEGTADKSPEQLEEEANKYFK